LESLDWRQAITDHGPRVWATVYRVLGNEADAEDCFQEAFLAAFKVGQRQQVRDLEALLVRAATARAIDRLRQKLRHPTAVLDCNGAEPVAPAALDPAEWMERREQADVLRSALVRVPPQQAEAFCLKYLSDMTQKEIGREMGVSESAAGVLVHRAKVRLRELLDRHGAMQKGISDG
jgi:RNA polymerase sigma factor (sigma-70 family)